MDISPVYTADFSLLSRNVTRSAILGAIKINALSFSLFDNAFVYWNRSIV